MSVNILRLYDFIDDNVKKSQSLWRFTTFKNVLISLIEESPAKAVSIETYYNALNYVKDWRYNELTRSLSQYSTDDSKLSELSTTLTSAADICPLYAAKLNIFMRCT